MAALPSVAHDAAVSDEEVQLGISLSQEQLLSLQKPDGYWIGELIVDSTLCSDHVLYMHWRGKVDPELQEKCVRHIRRRQLPDGGWNIYHGGPSEINACVKAYFALKLAGHSPQAPWMAEARANILRLGGIPKCNTYSKLYLALLGQFPWKYLPIIPVELILLPDWLYFNIYQLSSWSRAMLMPLAIINHFKPTKQLPEEKQLHELYPCGLEGADFSLARSQRFLTWRNFFLRCDGILKWLDALPWRPFRARALRRAEAWMTERMGEGSDGLAAIFPAMLNGLIALEALGYTERDAIFQKATRDYEDLFADDGDDFRIQPCFSPVWDTAVTSIALAESGLDPAHPALQKASSWLYSKEVRIRGDWVKQNPYREASGWAFEFNNVYYPDTDDTAMVLMALRLMKPENPAAANAAFQRALGWQMSFQCRDGGWAAFDKDVTKGWLEDVPFADHNAILDPTCSDLTARTLELIGYLGRPAVYERSVQRALAHLRRTQEDDGSWYGRWGVNYLYGTWQVLRGLRAIDQDMTQSWVRRGRDWLASCQNEDGGWGESCASYDDPLLKGKGPSTASQTAWALMGLIAAGDLDSPHVQFGLRYLLDAQNADGSWTEDEITGTGFPRVFYLKYDMYRNNFPLLALATYLNAKRGIFRLSHVQLVR
ncbi:MAG: squalene--hopene cyclase [Verrucomicrobia bacterium]|nr:squalene--hopene cyclase [Verrucomicrobiota bacterium]